METALRNLNISQSRWTRKSEWGIPRKHCLLSQYQPQFRPRIRDVFTFVRHPITYYESVWRYLSRPLNRKRSMRKWDWHPFNTPASVYSMNFNYWVSRMLDEHPGWISSLYELYVGPEGDEFCRYIGRTKHLPDHLIEILSNLGYSSIKKELVKTLGKQNAGVQIPITWEKGLKERVLESEMAVLNRFYSEETRIVFRGDVSKGFLLPSPVTLSAV